MNKPLDDRDEIPYQDAFKADLIDSINRLIDTLEERITTISNQAETLSVDVQAMQARADSNRDNAATLFGDVLYCGCAFARRIDSTCNWEICFSPDDHPKAWRRKDTGKRVVFTPYGWVDEPE